jgi:hypothetical protein
LNACRCKKPRINERNPDFCRTCGVRLSEEWLSTDENVSEFFDLVAPSPDVHDHFIQHCRDRERAGRDEFGLSYLIRDNEHEAMEEVADFAIYMYLTGLQRRRQGRYHHEAKALEAVRHAAIAHRLAAELAGEG